MIERSELDGQLESLERQRAEQAATLQQIDGAIRAVRHLIDVSSRKAILARQEADKNGVAVAPATA